MQDEWFLELEAEVGVRRSCLGAHDAAFNHAIASRSVGGEAGRNRHFDDDLFVAGNALDGDKRASGTDVERGAEFKDGTPVSIGSVYKNGKRNGKALPSTGLVLRLTHV